MRKIIIYTIIFLFLFNSVCSATYYIDPTCTTSGTGTSQTCDAADGPFKAWSELATGCGGATCWETAGTYLQKAGTNAYGAVIVGASGNLLSYLIIGKYGTGADPIVTGLNPDTNIVDVASGIKATDKSYIYISNIKGRYIQKYGVQMYALNSPSTGHVVKDSDFDYCGIAGVAVFGTDSTNKSSFITVDNVTFSHGLLGSYLVNYVEDTTVKNSHSDHAYWHGFNNWSSVAEGCAINRITYENNVAHDTLACPPAWAAEQSYVVGESTVQIVDTGIYYCIKSHTSAAENAPDVAGGETYWVKLMTFTGCAESSGIQFDNYSCNCTAIGNTLYNNLGVNGDVGSGRGITANAHAVNPTIINNYIYNNSTAGIWFVNSTGDVIAANNTLVGNDINIKATGDDYDSILIKNNIIKDATTTGVVLDSDTNLLEGYNSFYGNTADVSGFTKDASDIATNPLLINGFEIDYLSPCKDTGVDLSTELGCTNGSTCTGIRGTIRPYNSLWDIGASELTPHPFSQGSLTGSLTGGAIE